MTFEALKDAANRLDARFFLFSYLTLIKEGVALDVPRSNKLSQIETDWQDCIPLSVGVVHALFVKKLALVWKDVTAHVAFSDTDDFIEKALGYLMGKNRQAQTSHVTIDGVQVPKGGNPLLEDVVVDLSHDHLESQPPHLGPDLGPDQGDS